MRLCSQPDWPKSRMVKRVTKAFRVNLAKMGRTAPYLSLSRLMTAKTIRRMYWAPLITVCGLAQRVPWEAQRTTLTHGTAYLMPWLPCALSCSRTTPISCQCVWPQGSLSRMRFISRIMSMLVSGMRASLTRLATG